MDFKIKSNSRKRIERKIRKSEEFDWLKTSYVNDFETKIRKRKRKRKGEIRWHCSFCVPKLSSCVSVQKTNLADIMVPGVVNASKPGGVDSEELKEGPFFDVECGKGGCAQSHIPGIAMEHNPGRSVVGPNQLPIQRIEK
jgi:hypothetical protein